ncbi:N-acetylglucosaminylphosphatidylinositol deacetylase [Nematocida minor]|uniref:N-acetylglucosaminylphosphatidylinositol deacetylase n=1 Tax=Nematocida minor TaxID=1912983 RepID=UPI00221FF97A|nr:N-acetylglucosaminylphosphatidylinositol deacetylase [Nematocida minor]KAI5189419.1 N-acetylglucosaminylphosphatidylinositol deacetylase [Nematocida minor]
MVLIDCCLFVLLVWSLYSRYRMYAEPCKTDIVSTFRYFLIIAHADDESMFFGPFITQVVRRRIPLSIVVCTDGGKGGCPHERKQEMIKLSRDHKIPVYFLDYPDGELENTPELQKKVHTLFKLTNSTQIVTFDEHGVSSHRDHKACYMLGMSLARKESRTMYALKSLNLIEKYAFLLSKPRNSADTVVVKCTFHETLRNRMRMFYYPSQMAWFRYLYVIFSSYMDYNVFIKVDV